MLDADGDSRRERKEMLLVQQEDAFLEAFIPAQKSFQNSNVETMRMMASPTRAQLETRNDTRGPWVAERDRISYGGMRTTVWRIFVSRKR
jgi:hypothetical protein